MSTLHINSNRDGCVLILSVVGDLDLGTCRWLADFLEGLPHRDQVVVDLHEVRLCDAASMSTFVRISDSYRACEGWLRLADPCGMVARTFAVFAFGQIMPTYATVAGAVVGDESQRIIY